MAKRIKRMKLCECGCSGYARPGNRFIDGHVFRGAIRKGSENPFFGKKHTEESIKSMSVSQKKRFENEEERAKYSAMAKARKKPPKPPKPRVLCKCGCGELANPGRSFIRHHQNIGPCSQGRREKLISTWKKRGHPWTNRSHTKKSRAKMRKARLGKELPDEIRANMSKAQSGENNPAWRGGIRHDPYCPIFSDPGFKEMIFKRDGYECQNHICWKSCEHLPLIPHHINYDKQDCDTKNIITVCWSCNSRANTNRKFWQKHYEDIMKQTKGGENEQG